MTSGIQTQELLMAPSVSFPTLHGVLERWLCHTSQWWPAGRAQPVGDGTSQNKPTSKRKGKQQLGLKCLSKSCTLCGPQLALNGQPV